MNLTNHYWFFEKALSSNFCNKIIKTGLDKQQNVAITSQEEKKGKKKFSKKEIKDLKKVRDSNIVWLNDQWIYDEILPYIHTANKNAGWDFQFDWSESCQFTIYKENQHYQWHCDSYEKPYNNPNNLNFHGKIRKISLSISLSDPKNYKGGELEFDFRNRSDGKSAIKECIEIKPRGSIVIFPSFIWHRVKPVISGTRYSLVIWSIGKPFK